MTFVRGTQFKQWMKKLLQFSLANRKHRRYDFAPHDVGP